MKTILVVSRFPTTTRRSLPGDSSGQDLPTYFAKQESRDEVLDKGFSLLRADLAREFHTQIAEVNGVPGCIGLAIDFRPEERTVEIKGKEPIEFYYFIQVSLAKDETAWRYDGGKSTQSLRHHRQTRYRC